MLCVSLGLVGCATALPVYDYGSEPDPRKQDYVVGPGDVIRINVWQNVDLTGESTVRPDGTIAMPLIGEVKAAGRTAMQIRDEIAKRLMAFVKQEAVVVVSLQTINSYRFTVAGNAEHGGLFSVAQFVTVTEALALAGGPNRFANQDAIVIIRKGGDAVRRIPINLKAILSGRAPEMNVVILAGDTVYVP